MLALSDQGLAHLAIAATAIAPAQRRRWLRELAADLDADPAKQRHARRMRRHRARQARGERCYRLVLADAVMESVIDGLIASGRLRESDSTRREAVEAALGRMIAEIGKRWRERLRKFP